jgi:hypothetical protein
MSGDIWRGRDIMFRFEIGYCPGGSTVFKEALSKPFCFMWLKIHWVIA